MYAGNLEINIQPLTSHHLLSTHTNLMLKKCNVDEIYSSYMVYSKKIDRTMALDSKSLGLNVVA